MQNYNFSKIESKWQKFFKDKNILLKNDTAHYYYYGKDILMS